MEMLKAFFQMLKDHTLQNWFDFPFQAQTIFWHTLAI